MSARIRFSCILAVTLAATIIIAGCDDMIIGGASYQRTFDIANCTMSPTGRNDYFILEPGHRILLEGGDTKVEVVVLDETKTVDGIKTRVIEEREWIGGELYEIARNYFSFCEQTKDVFYFGEDVDFYENGKVVKHDGTWLAGENGAKAGLIMPGSPTVGKKYYQEVAPGVAMDRAEVVSLDETCTTPAGTFAKCMKIKERSSYDFWTSLLFWEAEFKFYAPGIGLIQDEELLLIKHGSAEKNN